MTCRRKGGGSGPGHLSALCRRGSPSPSGGRALEENSGIDPVTFQLDSVTLEK